MKVKNKMLIGFSVFYFGSIIGSLMGAFIERRGRLIEFLLGRSYCVNCKSYIPIYYNIPIFSYIFLRGKCHNCKEKIPIYNLFYEITMGSLFLIVFINKGLSIEFFLRAIQITILLTIAFTDLKIQYIYTFDLVLLLISEVIYKYMKNQNVFKGLYPMVMLLVIFLLIYFISGGIGEGDIYLGAISGFFTNNLYEGFILFRNSFIIAALVAIILLILKRKKKEDAIAFAPYIVIGIIKEIL
ncbi:prepilin peptidase [Anaerosphaera multitolerans]|uniref:prepilin peptidase n=1 Tax=Anaerosphaera multitolerans TaxID=2487351 RepID=UPI0013E36FB3|nr:A24 family peptidase [Anaerosphaera multitolerans]